MKKITILGANLSEVQKERLEAIGSVSYHESPDSAEEFVQVSNGADVIFSDGSFLLESLPRLRDVFVTYPYVELGAFNTEELKSQGVTIANGSGGNRDSIAEWAMYMILDLFRKFGPMVRAKDNFPVALQESLVGKKTLIVGHGTIGSRIGKLCEAFGMEVSYFDRGDILLEKSKDADLVLNSLNCNSSSENLLDATFFANLKKGAYFVTFSRPYTYDIDGLIKAIDSGVVAGAAIDCDPESFGDTKNAFYQKCLINDKILVTPHIAFSTKQAVAGGAEVAVKNIEAYIAGDPQNIVTKI